MGESLLVTLIAVISCGGAPLETVKKYIENQRLPRRKSGRPKKNDVA